MGWFGSLGLAWKYSIVFGCLLVVTILAGLCKLLYSRKQLKKHLALKEEQNVAETDNLALNDRAKDEGDLFGVRALEAGYYGGVAQSRPSSPSPSSMGSSSRHPSISTNTLIGSAASQTPKLISPSTSVTTLPHSRNISEVATPRTPSSPPRRNPPPTLRLEPSQAELTGRKNHGVVEVFVHRPTSPEERMSPVSPTTPTSPLSPKSTSRHDDGLRSPTISVSAVSDDHEETPMSPELLRPTVYNPDAPQLPVVEAVSRISWRPSGADDAAANAYSMAASLDYTMGAPSTASNASSPARNQSPLPSPVRVYPQAYIPRRSRDECRSIFPAEPREPRSRKSSFSSVRSRRTKAEDEEEEIPAVPSLSIESEFYILQPTVYTPQHKREVSASESAYSTDSLHRRSSVSSVETVTEETLPATKIDLARTDSMDSRRNSIGNNSLMPPPSPNPSSKDRFSEFFDAYYRNSQSMVGSEPSFELARVETLAVPRHSTIVEVPTPLASPMPDKKHLNVHTTETGVAF